MVPDGMGRVTYPPARFDRLSTALPKWERGKSVVDPQNWTVLKGL
jgi:hypothetical protein